MSKKIMVGKTAIGGGSPITVQSMLSIVSSDIEGNVEAAKRLESAGCEILRVAIPDTAALALIPALKDAISIPLVADIHYDYRLALEAVSRGIDKIRINPGNIGDESRIKEVAVACRNSGIPIRIGVNSGSVEKEILSKYGVTAKGLVESALSHIRLLEKYDFNDICVAIKSSNVPTMIQSYRMISEITNYPLHLGVTEAGSMRMGVIKSAIGIGSLLTDSIGDTIRVSLTDDPVEEVKAGIDILKALGIRKGLSIVSCPTCGRTKIDIIKLTHTVEEALSDCKKDIKVAIMGCVVNGPGESREADIGIAGGDGVAVLFKKGEIICQIKENEIVKVLLEEIDKL